MSSSRIPSYQNSISSPAIEDTIADDSPIAIDEECRDDGDNHQLMKEKAIATGSPSKKRGRKKTSNVWKSFKKIQVLKGEYDHKMIREIIAKMIMAHEYPFSIVEHAWFNVLLKVLNPNYEKISRKTIKNDCMEVYDNEKDKLKKMLKSVGRISLTSDTWTSNQTIGYMCLTAHFIDFEWKLQKRVINFCELEPPHTGVVIADGIVECLLNWGIENKISTITLDNASSNDVAVRFLMDNFDEFLKNMAVEMRKKFDKYWGECNMLMSIAAIMDPRYKMKLIKFCFPKIYSQIEFVDHILKVQKALFDIYIYEVYVLEQVLKVPTQEVGGSNLSNDEIGQDLSKKKAKTKGRAEFDLFLETVDTMEIGKSELEIYLEEQNVRCDASTDTTFDVLNWWKVNSHKFPILSQMAKDILSVPITTVTSKSAFSAGGRVLTDYRSSLSNITVEALVCRGSWIRDASKLQLKPPNDRVILS
uniref:Zinc finger BED domain-containing protein RICESLEEPER 2-like n=1 Tax=Ananas comosus var. bracteatus TaxID=296719 RepID=A0A6V7NYG8_ANACO|nr:unnamed protein product [Ananas comosus var. bracteatus]